MALYSSKIKCDIIDPAVDTKNLRVEFKLNSDTGYYPTLRLGNFGTVGGDVSMNKGVGQLGLIKHIVLLNGQEELDKLRFCNRYACFKLFNSTNSDNRDINSSLYNIKQGYAYNNNLRILAAGNSRNQMVVGDAINVKGAKSATVNIMELLPILQTMPVLDTSIFRDLKIVVEYDTSSSNWLHDNTAASDTIQPYLIAEEITDPSLVQKLSASFKSSVWNAIEHDQFQVPANLSSPAQTDTEQSVTPIINGFDNKYVSRIVMMKAFTNKTKIKAGGAGAVNYAFGDFVSLAQHKEKINWIINGKPLLSKDGLDTPPRKAMMLNDTWGPCNMVTYGNVEGVGVDGRADSTNTIGVPGLAGSKQGEDVGTQDFVGIRFDRRVNQLEIDYKRSTPEENETHASNPVSRIGQGLDVHIYAEVRKQMSLVNGRYIVSYV